MECKTLSPGSFSTPSGQLSPKSKKPTNGLSNMKARSDLSLWKNRTGRYALTDANGRFMYEDNGKILTTSDSGKAQTFADFDVAWRTAKHLNSLGYWIKQVVFLIC